MPLSPPPRLMWGDPDGDDDFTLSSLPPLSSSPLSNKTLYPLPSASSSSSSSSNTFNNNNTSMNTITSASVSQNKTNLKSFASVASHSSSYVSSSSLNSFPSPSEWKKQSLHKTKGSKSTSKLISNRNNTPKKKLYSGKYCDGSDYEKEEDSSDYEVEELDGWALDFEEVLISGIHGNINTSPSTNNTSGNSSRNTSGTGSGGDVGSSGGIRHQKKNNNGDPSSGGNIIGYNKKSGKKGNVIVLSNGGRRGRS